MLDSSFLAFIFTLVSSALVSSILLRTTLVSSFRLSTWLFNFDFGLVGQTVGPFRHHLFPGLKPGDDLDILGSFYSCLHVAALRRSVSPDHHHLRLVSGCVQQG